MFKIKSKKFFAFLLSVLIICSINVTAFASVYNYPVVQHLQYSEAWCGAATVQQNLEKITGSLISQQDIWNYIQAYNIESGWGTDPVGLASAMAHWTSTGYYYCNWRYSYSTGATRGIANNIEQWGAPIAVLISHGGHWITINGVDSNVYVPSNYSTATVNGFYVTDPDPFVGSPMYYANTYFDANTFMTQYMTPIITYRLDSSGNKVPSIWENYYVSVERNANTSYNRGSYIDTNSFSHY